MRKIPAKPRNFKRGKKAHRASNFAAEWLDMKGISEYSSLSVRTLWTLIHDSHDPLPARKAKRKWLIRRRVFDAYLEHHH
jgi:hypothetical protein